MFIGLLKPRSNRLGVDFAGTVEAVGSDVDILAMTKPGPTATWFSHFENAIFVTVDFTSVKTYRNPNDRHEGFYWARGPVQARGRRPVGDDRR